MVTYELYEPEYSNLPPDSGYSQPFFSFYINNHVILGQHRGESAVAKGAVGVLSGASRFSGQRPQQATVMAGAGGMHKCASYGGLCSNKRPSADTRSDGPGPGPMAGMLVTAGALNLGWAARFCHGHTAVGAMDRDQAGSMQVDGWKGCLQMSEVMWVSDKGQAPQAAVGALAIHKCLWDESWQNLQGSAAAVLVLGFFRNEICWVGLQSRSLGTMVAATGSPCFSSF